MQTGGNFWNNIKKQQVSTSATSATPYVTPKVSNTGIFSNLKNNLSKSLGSVKEKTKTGMSDVVHSVGISTDIDTFHSKQVPPVKLNYSYATSNSDIEAQKASLKNAGCKIYITCENANLVKNAIKKKLEDVTKAFDMSEIDQINTVTGMMNQAGRIFKENWGNFYRDLEKQIQKAKQKESEVSIIVQDPIAVKFQFTKRTDFEKQEGKIVQINVVDESVTIEYTAMNSSIRKEKAKISDLCIYDDEYTNTVDCNLQEGGSKNKRASRSMKGGSTNKYSTKISSISTSDLC